MTDKKTPGENIPEPTPMKVEITNQPEYEVENIYDEIENPNTCKQVTPEQIEEFLEDSKEK